MFLLLSQRLHRLCVTWLAYAAMASTPALALDSFRSIDNRLPNPDRPYDMTSGTVLFPPSFALYDLVFQPKDPSQLDLPTREVNGNWEFDSSFDIVYRAVVSFALEPPHLVTGGGTAHMTGVATSDPFHQVFDTELVELNLVGLGHTPDFLIRESPALDSKGITTRDDLCPPCATAFTRWEISSFFDVFAEVSFDGGSTWSPGDKSLHIEQPTNPFNLADFNSNGSVDAADYVTWRSGSAPSYTSTDYNLWRSYYGEPPANEGTGANGGIPEPLTCGLLTIAAFTSALLRFGPRSRCTR
jgi:hypothetical protein